MLMRLPEQLPILGNTVFQNLRGNAVQLRILLSAVLGRISGVRAFQTDRPGLRCVLSSPLLAKHNKQTGRRKTGHLGTSTFT